MTSTPSTYLYERVEAQVRNLIEQQMLRPGERIPSLRRMSDQARVSLATVMQAYMSLERKGLIEARAKSGFYVRPDAFDGPPTPESAKTHLSPRRVLTQDLAETIFRAAKEPGIVSFGLADPSPALLPVKALSRSLSRILARDRLTTLQYGYAEGEFELRRQIALRMTNIGSPTVPDQVVVTNGATEALTLSLQTVARPGDVIAVESPTYHAVLRLIGQLGLLALEIRTDPQTGLVLDDLRQALDYVDVRALLAVPNFSNPLGSLMPDDKKAELAALLSEREIPLIEDDIYGELHFGTTRPRQVKSYDQEGWVLCCSSFSKTLAPGYRVGWVCGGRFSAAIKRWKWVTNLANPTLPQLAVAEFLNTGGYDRCLRRVRAAYREQVGYVRNAIGNQFPAGTKVSRPHGGFVLWVELPRNVDATQLLQKGLDRGISIIPGGLFSPTGKYRNYFRVACGLPWSAEVERALTTLGGLAHELCEQP